MSRNLWLAAVALVAGAGLLLTPGTNYAKGGGGGGGGGGHGGGGGGHGGGGGGHAGGGGGGWHGGGGAWHGGGGYYHRGGYYPGYGYWGGYGLGLGYYPGYGYGYGGYYDNGYYGPDVLPASGYAVPAQGYQPPYPLQGPPGYAQAPVSDPNVAGFVVQLPDPNAEVWFQNYQTKQQGTVREYESSALNPGQTYTFTVRARWTQNGQTMDRTRSVQARPGQHVNVDFTRTPREIVPVPSSGK